MNDEEFETALASLELAMWPSTAEKMRARDKAQRESIARLEADRDRYKVAWMEFMDRTDWMQEKGQVPAKYLGQHRADIITAMLNEARAALSTQPAAGEPEQQTAINADDLPTKKYPLGAFDFDAPVAAGEPVATVADGGYATNVSAEIDRLLPVGTKLYAAPPAAAHGDEAVASAKQLAESLKLVRRWERPGQATEWEFEVPGSFNRHVVASSEQAARAKIAQDVRREAPPAAAHGDEADQFFEQVKAELRRARAKFPGDRIMTLALAEEFGELCKAVLDESAEAVRKEAVQVACMAARVVLDGDGSVVEWRRERGLDPLLADAAMRAQAGEGGEV